MRYVIYYFSKNLRSVRQRFKYFDLWLDVFVWLPLVYLQHIKVKDSLKDFLLLRDTFSFHEVNLPSETYYPLLFLSAWAMQKCKIEKKVLFIYCFLVCPFKLWDKLSCVLEEMQQKMIPIFYTVLKVMSLTSTLLNLVRPKENHFTWYFSHFFTIILHSGSYCNLNILV